VLGDRNEYRAPRQFVLVDIRAILRALGITKSSLFPDLAALAEELKSRIFFQN
jgi:hypothetical protein